MILLGKEIYTICKPLNIPKEMHKNRNSSLMTLVCTWQMKIRSWLHPETRAISFNCCQFFSDLLPSYKKLSIILEFMALTDQGIASCFSSCSSYKPSIISPSSFRSWLPLLRNLLSSTLNQVLTLQQIRDFFHISCISDWKFFSWRRYV